MNTERRFYNRTVGSGNIRLITMFAAHGMYYEVSYWNKGSWVMAWSKSVPLRADKPTNQGDHERAIQEQEDVARNLLRRELAHGEPDELSKPKL
jgi:hypothetical protein